MLLYHPVMSSETLEIENNCVSSSLLSWPSRFVFSNTSNEQTTHIQQLFVFQKYSETTSYIICSCVYCMPVSNIICIYTHTIFVHIVTYCQAHIVHMCTSSVHDEMSNVGKAIGSTIPNSTVNGWSENV